MTIATVESRNWDMSTIWPSLDSPKFTTAYDKALGDLGRLASLYDELGIDAGTPIEKQHLTLESLLTRSNAVLDELETLSAYLYCFTSVDTRDELAKAKLSEYESRAVVLSKLMSR